MSVRKNQQLFGDQLRLIARLCLSSFVTLLCLFAVWLVIRPVEFAQNGAQTIVHLEANLTMAGRVEVPNPHDFELCERVNQIPVKAGTPFEFEEARTPFSLRDDDFQRHHPRDCHGSNELLDAIKYGHREWPAETRSLDILEKARVPSTFIPYQCHIPTMEPTEMCTILNKFC